MILPWRTGGAKPNLTGKVMFKNLLPCRPWQYDTARTGTFWKREGEAAGFDRGMVFWAVHHGGPSQGTCAGGQRDGSSSPHGAQSSKSPVVQGITWAASPAKPAFCLGNATVCRSLFPHQCAQVLGTCLGLPCTVMPAQRRALPVSDELRGPGLSSTARP